MIDYRFGFSARVNYSIPNIDELKSSFNGGVSENFDGIIFKPIKSCERVSRVSRDVQFLYIFFDGFVTYEKVMYSVSVYADPQLRLRPALPEELICFAEKYPDEQCSYRIMALGAIASAHYYNIAFLSGFRCVGGKSHSRCLSLSAPGSWGKDYRFLFVLE